MERKLTKSLTDRKICGVCGGIAEYFAMDSTIVRLLWVIASLAFGSGLLVYIVMALVMPQPQQ